MHASNIYKAEKGLLRINFDVVDGKISSMMITGDFFLIPEPKISSLERILDGKKFEKEEIAKAVSEFYKTGVLTPSVTQEDFVNAITGAKYENETA